MNYQKHTEGPSGALVPMSFFLLGVAAGGALAGLLSPRSGTEWRRVLRRNFFRAKNNAGKQALSFKQRSRELLNQAEDLLEESKHTLSEQGSRIESAVQAAREAYARGE